MSQRHEKRLPPSLLDAITHEAAEQSFASLSDAQVWMDAKMRHYNQASQPDLGGLSPEQMYRLLQTDWEPDSVVKLRHDLRPEDVAQSAWYLGARAFLQWLDARGGWSMATEEDDASVSELGEHIFREVGQVGLAGGDLIAGEMPFGENFLHELITLVTVARLLRQYRGKRVVTKRARALCKDEAAGELYALLFVTFVRDIDITNLYDAPEEFRELQDTLPFVLYRLNTEARRWEVPHKLMKRVLHPETMILTPELDFLPPQARSAPIAVHILQPLVQLGLLEQRLGSPNAVEPQYRQTPLFQRFIQFDFGPSNGFAADRAAHERN